MGILESDKKERIELYKRLVNKNIGISFKVNKNKSRNSILSYFLFFIILLYNYL